MPPTGVNYDPTKKYNYTQIFRNTLEMTRTASKTRLRTGDQVKEAKRECLELHSIEMEKGFIWGAKGGDDEEREADADDRRHPKLHRSSECPRPRWSVD